MQIGSAPLILPRAEPMLGHPLMADGTQIRGAIAAEPGREQRHHGADGDERDEDPCGVHNVSPVRGASTASTTRISFIAFRSIFRISPLGIRAMS